MSENTKIEWCDHTFNPWEGCQAVSPGCDHCYAEARNARFGGGQAVNFGPGAPRRRTNAANWARTLKWNAQAYAFMVTHGRRQRVFCASLADVFDNQVPGQWRMDLFKLIADTPNLDWLILTKRIGNVMPMLNQSINDIEALSGFFGKGPHPMDDLYVWLADWAVKGKAPKNIWLGATIVNQTEADRDIPKLLAVPAAKRFLSMEPLLGPVDLAAHHDWLGRSKGGMWCPDCPERGVGIEPSEHSHCHGEVVNASPYDGVDWVIVGGESGPGARPMHPEWARSLRDQCDAAGVPFLFKQWGEWAPRAGKLTGGGVDFQSLDPACERWPQVIRLGEHGKNTRICENCTPDMGEEVFVQRVGKKAAGRLLDGIEHNGFPS
jgi:protein gp37